MSFNFGGGAQKQKGSTIVQMPSASAQEQDLQKANLEMVQMQLAQMKQASADQTAYDASPQGQLNRQINEKAAQNIYARLTGTQPVITPEEQARLDTVFNTASQRGTEDITRFARDLASARGMSVSDSPIGDAAMQEQRKFQEGMTSQRAASSLDLGNAAADFNARLAAFQEGLRQQAYQNRMLMASTAPASYGYENALFGQRYAAAPRSSTGLGSMSQWGAGFNLGQTAQGAGAAMQAYPAFAKAWG